MQKKMIPYAFQSIDESDISEVVNALKSGNITRGPAVEAFEQAVANFCHVKHAVAFNSGTSALLAAGFAAEIGSNDRLLTTPNTFVASISTGYRYGATPVFIDIDRKTGNLDLNLLEFNLNQPSSRGRTIVVPVHFSGIPVDMQTLDSMIKNPETVVIEDAAHAFGSTYQDGQRVGSCAFSQMTMFSFHPAKILTTGEGGIVTTNDDALAHKLRRFRNNGIERDPSYLVEEAAPWYYEVHEVTNNYNFTDFQAALGLSQLKRIDAFIEKRRMLVQLYREKLKGLSNIRLFTQEFDASTAFHLFVVQIDFKAIKKQRAQVMDELKAKGVGTQVHYIPVYRHPFFKKFAGDISEYFPETEAYYKQCLSLPLFYDLSEDDVTYVVNELKSTIGEN